MANEILPKELAEQVTARFFIPPEGEMLFPRLESVVANLPPEYAPLGAAFVTNLFAVRSTAKVPFTLANAATERAHWQRISVAERIRSRNLSATDGESEPALEVRRDATAYEVARTRMREFAASDNGRSVMAADTCRFMLDALSSGTMGAAADELILQGEVLAWSALESLARDVFETALNRHPEQVLELLRDPVARQRLPAKFALEELATLGFDLSSTLGSVLTSHQDFSDLRTIRAILPLTLGSDEVAAALADPRLWALSQRRHLILHRRGVVDRRFLDATGENLPLGTRIVIKPADLVIDITAVAACGGALLAGLGALPA